MFLVKVRANPGTDFLLRKTVYFADVKGTVHD